MPSSTPTSNLAASTFSEPQTLISGQLGTTDVALYTVPANQSARLGTGTLCGVSLQTAPTLTLGATATTGGTFAGGAYSWKVTAVNAVGQTLGSNEVTATLAVNGTQVLNWTAQTGAVSYNVYRGVATGAENVLVANVTVLTYTDTGAAGTASTSPPTVSTYSVPVVVSLSIIKAGGTVGDGTHRIVNAYTLTANDTLSLRNCLAGHFMGPGDIIAGFAATAAAVVVVISGVVFS